jgi:superfamily II DNA or RNA helicase
MLDALYGAPDAGREPMGSTRDTAAPARRQAPELTAFQEEARHRVDVILGRYRGAILADSVGLGKTYVALALAEREVAAGRRVLVIVPASLRAQWRPLLRGLGGGWSLYTHAALSRGRGPDPGLEPSLIVVDEAHRFRNPRTRRYGALARLTWAGSRPRVLLVTATPVNNDAGDLLHLLRLFLADDGLLDAGVPSLTGTLDDDGRDGAQIRSVVDAVVVRRTRSLLGERFGPASAATDGRPIPRFPRRAPPRVAGYRDPALPGLVEAIAGLELAPYEYRGRPGGSTGDGAGGAALLRLNLLKRLDSSPAAFLASLGRLGHTLAAVRDAARAGRLLGPGSAAPGAGDGDPLQLVLLEVVADRAPPGLDLDALAGSAGRDLRRLDRMRALRGSTDHKRDTLVALLHRLAPERVVVFTEYRDTAADLWRALRGRLRVARVDGAGAWLGARPAGRRVVVERFAPMASARPAPPDRERVDVLIATDVLAEGMNLQDARHVISYDLPWNPVRLMQRIGRVDRLGSPHPVVVPHLFVPALGLDAILGLRSRLLKKLDGIAATGGAEDAGPLLAALAAGGPVDSLIDGDPARGSAVDSRPGGAADPGEALRTLWIRTRSRDRPAGLPEGASPRDRPPDETLRPAIPWAAAAMEEVPGQAPADPIWVVAVRERDRTRILQVGADRTPREVTGATVAALAVLLGDRAPAVPWVECAEPTAPPRWLEPSVRRCLRLRTAERGPTPALPRSDPARRLARHLKRAIAGAGLTAGPGRIRQAGLLLDRLARPLDPAAADRATAALADLRREEGGAHTGRGGGVATPRARQIHRARALHAAIERVRHVLEGAFDQAGNGPTPGPPGRDSAGPTRKDSTPRITLVAALRIAPETGRGAG